MKPTDNRLISNLNPAQSEQLFARVRGLRNNSVFYCGEDELQLQGLKQTVAWKSLVNRSCGDSLTMAIQEDDDRPLKMVFSGFCCTLCHAAAEIICQSFDELWQARTQALERPLDLSAIQSAIVSMPSRKKCADLPWEIATELIAEFAAARTTAPILAQRITHD